MKCTICNSMGYRHNVITALSVSGEGSSEPLRDSVRAANMEFFLWILLIDSVAGQNGGKLYQAELEC